MSIPHMIPKDHGLATINGVDNAIFLDSDPLGDVFTPEGQGAGADDCCYGRCLLIWSILGIRVDAPAVIWTAF